MTLRFSEEVVAARAGGIPLVALESSVIAQGLPAPDNLDAARRCEAAIRRAGACPATIAVIDGEIRVGLPDGELQRLAQKDPRHRKIGSRDLAPAWVDRATGGTTVSATCEIAARAGIRVFATGGLGGIHRGFPEPLDVSQDLWALSRFPVAVVCAGAKSVLDLPKTMEALEALAVPVVGVGTSELPAFYCARSGLALEHRVEDADGAAALLAARLDALGQGGLVFALPPPADAALEHAEVEALVDRALGAAAAQGVTGKAVTPFLLAELARQTGGRSLMANLALLEHNARFAGELAVRDGAHRR